MGGNPFKVRGAANTPDEIRREVQREFRWYLLVVAVVSAVVGGVIGQFGFGPETTQTAVITPPPWDNIPCPPVQAPEAAAPRDIASRNIAVAIPTVTPEPLQVYVAGAVINPGLVTLPAGSLAAAAVEAAGGPAEDADLEALNLAAPLLPNQQLVVPRQETEAATPAAATALNINTATVADLESLPHIGPTRAQQIVTYREEHGPFASKEDLQNVSGIGPATFADIEPYITVEP